jgi:hypothetical protein
MKLKRSTLAGTWYPGGATELAGLVDRLLAAGDAKPLGELLALIVPHAGYQYSGAVAASAYRQLRERPCGRIAILAPSHRRAFRGVAVLEADAFETPLGRVAIDPVPELRSALLRGDSTPFEGEHSLEIQLPFLQRAVPGATVVPLLFGGLRPEDHEPVGEALGRLRDGGTLFLVSSDFTHYGRSFDYLPFPPAGAEAVRRRLRELDMAAIRAVLGGEAAAFRRHLEETGDTVCGRVPITAFLEWAGPAHPGELLDYRTSLDVTGDYEHTVSYAAIAFPRRD